MVKGMFGVTDKGCVPMAWEWRLMSEQSCGR